MTTQDTYRGWGIEYDGETFSWDLTTKRFTTLLECTQDIDQWESMMGSGVNVGDVRHA